MKSLLIVILMFTSIVHAGTEGTGGGDGFMCPKKDAGYPDYDLRLVDTYGDTSLDEIVDGNVGQLMQPWGMRTLARFLDRKMPAAVYPHPLKIRVKIPFGTFLLLSHMQLYFYHSDRPEFLPDIPDDKIPWWKVPKGCKKIQLAIQDFKTSTVQMNWHNINLPVFDRLFLDLHETLLSLRNKPGLDTTPIRRDVERLANMIRKNKADFVRGLTKDWEDSILSIPDDTPALVIPPVLRCKTTWRTPRIDKFQPEFELGSTFMLRRVKGSGQSTDKNSYQLTVTPGQTVESFETEMLQQQPTFYSPLVANEISAFETHFEIPRGVTYTLQMLDRVDGADVYIGNMQASFTNKEIAAKSKQMSSHEFYNGAGVMCVAL